MSGNRVCVMCKETKPLDGFYAHNRGKDGRQNRCKPCSIAYVAAWQKKNRSRALANGRKSYRRCVLRRIGITEVEYTAAYEAQGGTCAICRDPTKTELCIDHDHATSKFRGLLCTGCNKGIGLLGDNAEGLRSALAYLERTKEPASQPKIVQLESAG